jgi:hypothetical protein
LSLQVKTSTHFRCDTGTSFGEATKAKEGVVMFGVVMRSFQYFVVNRQGESWAGPYWTRHDADLAAESLNRRAGFHARAAFGARRELVPSRRAG